MEEISIYGGDVNGTKGPGTGDYAESRGAIKDANSVKTRLGRRSEACESGERRLALLLEEVMGQGSPDSVEIADEAAQQTIWEDDEE